MPFFDGAPQAPPIERFLARGKFAAFHFFAIPKPVGYFAAANFVPRGFLKETLIEL